MPELGGSIVPQVDVYTWDTTTAATLTVIDPDGVTTAGANPVANLVTVTADGVPTQVQRWTVDPIMLGKPKRWVFVWHVVNTGGGTKSETVWVEAPPQPGGVAWRPTLSRVASYVPSRPLVPAADGSNRDLMTFDATTRPTGAQVDQLIDDAVNWVTDRCGTLATALYESATACAAIRAAGFVELGYPERNDPMKSTANTTSDRLLKQADLMLESLAARNEALTGADGDTPDPAVALMPRWSFPPAPAWGDQLL